MEVSEQDDELLIVPFPEPEIASILTDMRKFRGYLSELLEYIFGGRQQWYPADGFRNLAELPKQRLPFLRIPPPRHFQVIRLDQPLDIVLRQLETPSRQTERDENEIGVFAETYHNEVLERIHKYSLKI